MSVSLLNQVLAADEAAFLTLLRGGEGRANTTAERLAILILAWRANDDGTAPDWMSISRLARESGLNRQNLHRVVKRLREAGILLGGLDLSLDALSLIATPTQPGQPVDNSVETVDNLSHGATLSLGATVARSDTPCRSERHKLSLGATPYRLDYETDARTHAREEAVHNSRPKVGDKGQGNQRSAQSGYAATSIKTASEAHTAKRAIGKRGAEACSARHHASEASDEPATIGRRQAQAEITLRSLAQNCGLTNAQLAAALSLAAENALTLDPDTAARNALAAVMAANGPKTAPSTSSPTTSPAQPANALTGR